MYRRDRNNEFPTDSRVAVSIVAKARGGAAELVESSQTHTSRKGMINRTAYPAANLAHATIESSDPLPILVRRWPLF